MAAALIRAGGAQVRRFCKAFIKFANSPSSMCNYWVILNGAEAALASII
jgi:hypothetical protein